MIEVDCRKCKNCTGYSCKVYGNNADVAVKKCANDNFNNYKELKETRIGFLCRNEHFFYNNQEYIILGIGNKDIDNVRCKNLKTNKIEWFDLDCDIKVSEEILNG